VRCDAATIFQPGEHGSDIMGSLRFTRRRFLLSSSVAAGAAICSTSRRPAYAQPGTGSPRIRRNIADLDPNGPEITALKAGIGALRARDQSDPTGWHQQALIHQDHCPHGNFFFLPWHRAYLLHFENLCRVASGNANFVLPYWNWSTSRRLPAVFWGDASNPLFHAGRDITPNSAASEFAVGQTIIANILNTNSFLTFGSGKPNPLEQRRRATTGSLEGGPHNYIHGFVGGDMSTFMSPLDPCFWLHHANVDRLWAEWDELHPTGGLTDPQWRGFNFANNFVDTSGMPLPTVTVESMLSTYANGYRYDTQDPLPTESINPLGAVVSPELGASGDGGNVSGAIPFASAVPLTANLLDRVRFVQEHSMADIVRETKLRPTVRLTIDGIRPPADENVLVRVFVNCDYLSLETPAHDPHFVGSIAFFGGDHDHGDGDHSDLLSYTFDLVRPLQQLGSLSGGDIAEQGVQAQLLAVPIHQAAPSKQAISFEGTRVELIEEPATE
jgi:tyrosinase